MKMCVHQNELQEYLMTQQEVTSQFKSCYIENYKVYNVPFREWLTTVH